MTTPAQRIHDSHQRAQNLPHRPGPVDPDAAARMASATQLALTGLPDPALFATWAGNTQATTALEVAARAYAEATTPEPPPGCSTRRSSWTPTAFVPTIPPGH